MATKIQKIASELNDEFRNDLHDEFLEKFGIEVVTKPNFLSGEIFTNRVDGKDFTAEQMGFMKAFEKGYVRAMLRVRKYVS